MMSQLDSQSVVSSVVRLDMKFFTMIPLCSVLDMTKDIPEKATRALVLNLHFLNKSKLIAKFV